MGMIIIHYRLYLQYYDILFVIINVYIVIIL